ncbi:hypothetical protein AWC38_SpisGene14149 [Stylophora pistillata]|uniref:MADF domain-containing protein n=1 Tax=Stylophora pistillata TaxID=50429 RepID=A0A2B4RYP5_STYPI|nr:hypothetical protein AWC38_SpisGene14149 [Stylophora pistillata]
MAQIKEKWRSLYDKYKAAKDHNNKTGRERKTFEFFDDIDEFLSGSDKVNPKFVKETRVKPKDSPRNSDSGNSDDLAAADPATAAVGEKSHDKNDSPCPPKKKKKRSSLKGKEVESTILNLMEAQQAAIEKADEKDERMLEALLKSQSDSQTRHQEFTLLSNTASSLAGNSIVIIIIAIIVDISFEFVPSDSANVVKHTACYDRVWDSPMIFIQALE